MRRVLDALFPRSCEWCGKTVPPPWERICPDCAGESVRAIPGGCTRCGENLAGAENALCYDCSHQDRGFDRVVPLFRYDRGPVSFLLLRFKFHQDKSAGRDLGRILALGLADLAELRETGLVCPVPVSPRSRRKRGFNQVELLLDWCSVSHTPLLGRMEPANHQISLGGRDRASSIKGQYALLPGAEGLVKGNHILLADDVVTTGSTMGEAARVLKNAGALSVTGLAFFRESLF